MTEGYFKQQMENLEGLTGISFHSNVLYISNTFSTASQRAPDSGELVIMGVDAIKPFLEVGVISSTFTSFQELL
ncbi:hypothetical protein HS088_TW09G01313 [Tripterygium wilfordii]|uniref:Uncharacterized protein n=1 Tax=Tripterygium wilfordii TaxID=458696 RepID=A0A7J7DA65_TRIWF|nr:hypothetical protein HS088_TW09G01313 [Tripterygium wilfordii]